MERNLKQKVDVYCNEFKTNIQAWFNENYCHIINQETGENMTNAFISYMLDFQNLQLDKDDFKKRHRVKNTVPNFCRCVALKGDGTRCSRRQKDETTNLCGTHIKGTNFGIIQDTDNNTKIEKIKLWLEEINGIAQYIDNQNNVYSTDDIMNNVDVPRIISKYGKTSTGEYYIIHS